jgi:hypothetical protein
LKRNLFISRALAFFVGAILFFFLPAALSVLLGNDTSLMLPLLITAYGASGVALGFFWPNIGWRLGLYLFAIWPPVLLFSVFLAGEVPWNLRAELRSLVGYFLILIAACLGGLVGSLIGRRINS